jgi:hypothetical protein
MFMSDKIRVFLGGGTAAQVFRQTMQADDMSTMILGEQGLWARMPPNKHMGQPKHLLHLPGQTAPAFGSADGQKTNGMRDFLTVTDFQTGLANLSNTLNSRDNAISLPNCRVTRIYRRGRDLRVTTSNPDMNFPADQVIIAMGIGPQAKIETSLLKGIKPTGLAYQQILDGVDYLSNPISPENPEILIYGGGANSAWVAELLEPVAKKLVWMARLGGSGFSKSNLPGNRNWKVLNSNKIISMEVELKEIRYQDLGPARKLRVNFIKKGEVYPSIQYFDQIIHSISDNPMQDGGMLRLLDPSIQDELQVVVDKDHVFNDKGDGVLAWGTVNRDVLIIGSAVPTLLTQKAMNLKLLPIQSLPTGAQVPAGITTAVSLISGLNNYIPITQDDFGNVKSSNINFNVADRNQLAVWLAIFYPDLRPSATNEIVNQIIANRSDKTKPWGLNEQEVMQLIEVCKNF